MIDKMLNTLKGAIAEYLEKLIELNITNQDYIKISSLVKQDGSLELTDNTLGITLVHISEERNLKSQNPYIKDEDGRYLKVNPALKLYLYVLITANFKDYKAGLGYLSGVIRTFQAKNVFTRKNTPAMDETIEKIIVELYSPSFEEQNHLWSALGAKYLPSVLYKVKMSIIQEASALESPGVITDVVVVGESSIR